MSSAERVIAFNSIFAALGVDPHEASRETKTLVHEAALKYARLTQGAPAESRQPQRPSQASSANAWVPPFGRNKGKPLHSLSVDDLRWYESALQRSIDDPDKQRFADANGRALEDVRAELRKRGEAANHG